MQEEEYKKVNIDKKIAWYASRSTRNRLYYIGLKRTERMLSALLPLLTFTASYLQFINVYSNLCSAVMSSIVTLIASVHGLSEVHENWRDYSQTAEALRREKRCYQMHASIYAHADNPSACLQARVNALIAPTYPQTAGAHPLAVSLATCWNHLQHSSHAKLAHLENYWKFIP